MLVDFTSELTAAHGAVELGGDPEHAGIQFRPSQKVAENKSGRYRKVVVLKRVPYVPSINDKQ